MRICSFLPSATEIVYALGLHQQLHGVTFECDYPAAARTKPMVVRSIFGETQLSSGEINAIIGQRLKEGLGIYDINLEVLQAAAPDLLLTQAICEVWAISSRQVAEASVTLPKQPAVVSLDPQSIEDVLEDVLRVARATGTEPIGVDLVTALQARIDAVRRTATEVPHRPKVLHLEWVEPLMCGGHWVPQMVEYAGGVNCFGEKKSGSYRLEWAAIVDSQPEVIILMPCGFDVTRGAQDLPLLTGREGWATLPAVQHNRVYVLDAGAYTSRSGPRLVRGLEIMATMIHPELFTRDSITAAEGVRVMPEQLRAVSV